MHLKAPGACLHCIIYKYFFRSRCQKHAKKFYRAKKMKADFVRLQLNTIFSDNRRAVKLESLIKTQNVSEEDGQSPVQRSLVETAMHRSHESLYVYLSIRKTRLYLRHWTTNPSKNFGYDKRPHESKDSERKIALQMPLASTVECF